MNWQPDVAIAGLGITEMGKVYGRSAPDFADEAVRLAVADAGLELTDLDGLLVNPGLSGGLDITLASRLGLHDLPLLERDERVRVHRERDGHDRCVRDCGGPGDDGGLRVRRCDAPAE